MARAKKTKATTEKSKKDMVVDVSKDVVEDVIAEESVDASKSIEEAADTVKEKIEDIEPEIDTSEIDTVVPVENIETAAPIIVKRGGFFPMLLGGIVAAVIGFVAAQYIEPGYWPFGDKGQSAFEIKTAKNIETQNVTIEELRTKLEELAAQTDTSAIKSAANDALGGVSEIKDELAQVDAKLNDLTYRLTDLEKRPITEGISDAAISAFEGELKAVQDAMAAQRADIAEATEAAAQMEANAALSETEAMKRAALSQIQTALDTGSAFSPAVANLEAAGESVPDALKNVAEAGVTTLIGLQEAFPIAARKALEAGRGEDTKASGIASFFRKQLGTRSLAPKEGSGTDAVLSRAEAALKDGRLLDTTAELAALPDAAKLALASWLDNAATRQNALAAVEALGQQLNSN